MRKRSTAEARNSTTTWPSVHEIVCVDRGPGGLRRKKKVETAVLDLVAPELAGDPKTGVRWTARSLARLQSGLQARGHRLARETIRRVLYQHKIRPKSNVKRLVPKPHPERDLQFRYIQEQRAFFERMGWPIISVDTKYKELIGPFKQPGTLWCAQAPSVYMHDFPSDAIGRAVPYGIYDTQAKLGSLYVGRSADTPEFAVDAITHWWQQHGLRRYSDAPELLILADSGGSNGYLPRNWKRQLQEQLADRFGLSVTVCHYPTGASKWNPIEHRLFSEVSKSLAGVPLVSFEVMLRLIEETETVTGLRVEARLVEKDYEKGIQVSDEEMAALALEKHATCPRWNYTIRPRTSGSNF
jgi:hypothetical protein